MALKVHPSAKHLRNRKRRLTLLQERIQQQLVDTECLIKTLEDYCRENPDDCACAANDPNWRDQLVRQRKQLRVMLRAVREKSKLLNKRSGRGVQVE